MFTKIQEAMNDPEIKSWLKFRLTHMDDKGHPPANRTLPPYLKAGQFQAFNSLRSKIQLPQTVPVNFNPDLKTLSMALPASETTFSGEDFTEFVGNLYQSLNDPEDRSALFRNRCLLSNLEQHQAYGPCELAVLDSWLNAPFHVDEASDPYNIAERLGNIGIFVMRSAIWQSWSEKEVAAFTTRTIRDAKQIFQNLEYFADLTSNHLANNGRGLIWAGFLCNNKKIAKIGLTIMVKEAERILATEGTLREGSPHYHVLLTKNYFEALWLCQQMELRDLEPLQNTVKKMLESAQFLYLDHHLPNIGDQSPDAPKQWLCDVRHIPTTWEAQGTPQLPQGWAGHFFSKIYHQEPRHLTGLRDDFAKCQGGPFAALVHINHKGYVAIPGHAHADSGAPYVTYNGEPFLLDLGRPSYTADFNKYQRAYAHNSVLINRKPLEYIQRGVYGPEFLRTLSEKPPVSRVRGNKISHQFFGYNQQGITIERSLVLGSEVELNFHIQGDGSALIEIPIHVAENANIIWPEIGEVGPLVALREWQNTVYSYEYGSQKACRSYLWFSKVSLPIKLTIIIKPEEQL